MASQKRVQKGEKVRQPGDPKNRILNSRFYVLASQKRVQKGEEVRQPGGPKVQAQSCLQSSFEEFLS